MVKNFLQMSWEWWILLIAHWAWSLFQVFLQCQYYRDLPGDLSLWEPLFPVLFQKSLGQKDQSKLAYHVTEALKITLLLKKKISCSALSTLLGKMIGLLELSRRWLRVVGSTPYLVGGSIVLFGLDDQSRCLIRATIIHVCPLYVSLFIQCLNILFQV